MRLPADTVFGNDDRAEFGTGFLVQAFQTVEVVAGLALEVLVSQRTVRVREGRADDVIVLPEVFVDVPCQPVRGAAFVVLPLDFGCLAVFSAAVFTVLFPVREGSIYDAEDHVTGVDQFFLVTAFHRLALLFILCLVPNILPPPFVILIVSRSFSLFTKEKTNQKRKRHITEKRMSEKLRLLTTTELGFPPIVPCFYI